MNIQIVIKISEDDYKEAKEDTYSGTPFENRVFSAIANGIPLPKGHGRLIDADKLLKQSYRIDDSATLSTRDVVNEEEIDDAPTIIEADKAESEEE